MKQLLCLPYSSVRRMYHAARIELSDNRFHVESRDIVETALNHMRMTEMENIISHLSLALKGIQVMAAEDIREGKEGQFTYQIEADARAALELVL